MSENVRTLKQTVFIPAPPREVYEAFLDPAQHAAFTGKPATGEPVVGGKFTAHGDFISGEILELVEGEKIVESWSTTGWPAGSPPSRLEITFRPKDGGTELTMVHSGVPAQHADSYDSGWVSQYWEPLQRYFEARATSSSKG
ncbi:MAG: SRPBCC domain-containing protein [Thermoanaerobaculia bacterium]